MALHKNREGHFCAEWPEWEFETGEPIPIPIGRLMIRGHCVRLVMMPDFEIHMMAPVELRDKIDWYEGSSGLGFFPKMDRWAHRSENMKCWKCMWFMPKGDKDVGRCRRRAPTISGYPVVFQDDWCGDHKLNEHTCLKIEMEPKEVES